MIDLGLDWSTDPIALAPKNDLLLLEVSSLLFVHQHQIEIISYGKLLIDILHGWREVVSRQEESNRYRFPSDRRTIHYFILRYVLIVIEGVLPNSSGLFLDDRNLHVLYLDSHQQKVDFAHNDILQVIPGKVVRVIENRRIAQSKRTDFDLLYSNSMCRQSSIPTSILIGELTSG